jgi:AraC family transcriptional regulator
MQSILKQAFRGDTAYRSNLEGRHVSRAHDIHVSNLRMPQAGEGIYYSSTHCFLQHIYIPETPLQGAYEGWSGRKGFTNVGELLFVPPGYTFRWHWPRGRQRTVACMFDVRLLGPLGGFEWDWGKVDLARTLDMHSEEIALGMKRLASELATPSFASDLQVEYLLTLIALKLRQFFLCSDSQQPDPPPAGKLPAAKLKRLQDFLDHAEGTDLTVADAAHVCGLPPRTFAHLFKQTTGTTLRSYLAHARLQKAKLYLHDETLLIKQIAFKCGFRSAEAFVAAFHKDTGLTPMAYRASRVVNLSVRGGRSH